MADPTAGDPGAGKSDPPGTPSSFHKRIKLGTCTQGAAKANTDSCSVGVSWVHMADASGSEISMVNWRFVSSSSLGGGTGTSPSSLMGVGSAPADA
jgi:hypothetical protein